MTIPKASALVIEAGTIFQHNEIFVFDMGEPVKINDFAKSIIRLAGYIPGESMDINITGLRPGEKLYEELFSVTEKLVGTHHPKIMKAMNLVIREDLSEKLEEMNDLLEKNRHVKTSDLIQELVPELSRKKNAIIRSISA
jgi:FlaA1/EpsC-like NDP-sugar epimerase